MINAHTLLLEQYSELAENLNQLNIQSEHWFVKSDLFNGSCFNSQSNELKDYLKELKQNINKLNKVTEQDFAEYLSEQITLQFTCLKSLVNAQQINKKNNAYRSNHVQRLNQLKEFTRQATTSSQELYQELSKLQEYERRLLDMVTEKKQTLSSYSGTKHKVEYQQQVLITEQRLGRCRQAISKVEEQIQTLEENN